METIPPSSKATTRPQPKVMAKNALKRIGDTIRRRAGRSGRRSLSAPPTMRRRRPMIEDHFRFDPEKKVVLPGAKVHDPDWDRDAHDFFNLVMLVPVVALNVMNWDWDLLMSMEFTHINKTWTGEYFYEFFGLTAFYFVVDLLWILSNPKCVRSPGTILQHHIATLFYILIPYHCQHVQWCMGACMSVEVNTWLLIARRVFNKQGFSPWVIDLSFVSVRIKLISLFFYLTWISIRCFLYPYMLPEIYEAWKFQADIDDSPWNPVLIALPLHTIFCLLNLKWSYDLLMSKIRYWRRRKHYQSDTIKDKGL